MSIKLKHYISMRMYNLIFSSNVFIRIMRHTIFWFSWYAYLVMVYLYNNSNIQNSFWLTLKVRCLKLLTVMPIQIIHCYLVVYWMIPKLLLQKRYILFIIIFLISSVGILYGVDIITFDKFDFSSLWENIMSYISRGSPVLCLVFVVVKMLKIWYIKETEKEMLLKENLNAELKLLNAQVHPHFLFNTLNNIYFFILSDAIKAQSQIKKFEKMLRYMITECDEPLVPLSKEINMIKNYFELEKVRYGNSLNIEMKVTDDKHKLAAPLLMIPFIENSFKHGASKMLDNPWIKLDIQVKNNTLYFYLANNKPIEDNGNSKKGIGLANVKKRLLLLYPEEHYLQIELKENIFIVEMHVPLHNGITNENKIITNELIPVPA